MRAMWKGTISFGLVNIPIALGVATQRSDPRFRTLDAETKEPIKQQLFSPSRGKTIDREETVKGYEVAKDQYVVVTDEELESVAVERRKTIDILAFIEAADVDPVYYDRTYYLEPQETAEKPYTLLLEAMKEQDKVALAKLVLSSKEHLALLRPAGDALVIELLFYPEDVRSKEEIENRIRGTKVTAAERKMATELIDSLSVAFNPEDYENEHKRELLEMIERKVAGEEIEIAPEAPEPAPVPDLMSALKASLDQAKEGAKAAPTKSNGGKPRAKSKSRAKPKSRSKSKSSAGNGKKPAAKGRKKAGSRS